MWVNKGDTDFFPVTMPLGLCITSLGNNVKDVDLRPLMNVRSGPNVLLSLPVTVTAYYQQVTLCRLLSSSWHQRYLAHRVVLENSCVAHTDHLAHCLALVNAQ